MKLALAALLLALALPTAAAAQGGASPLLPADHWAYDALRRLDALGLAGAAYDPGAGSVTRAEATRRLEAAAAASGDPRVARLAEGWRERLAEEPGAGAAGWGGGVEGGYNASRGGLLARYDHNETRFPTDPRDPTSAAYLSGRFTAVLGRSLALEVVPLATASEVRLESGQLTAGAGRWRGWAGRRNVGVGAEADGSAVLGRGVAFDGAGVGLDSARLPGPLRAAGPFRFEAFGARLHASGVTDDPWLAAVRVWVRPRPRLWIAASRAAILGGQGNTPLRWTDAPALLVGMASGAHGETENQVASLEARWRPPVGGLPLSLYAEWAADDFGLALFRVPGLITGVELPALPGLPEVGLALERTHFPAHTREYPMWYRHSALPWLDDRVPLGHPLGGNGTEWLARGSAALLAARLRLDGRAYQRDRGPENLFSPAHQGRSRGGALTAEWRPRPALEWFASAQVERGAGWNAAEVRGGGRLTLSPARER